MTDRKTKYKSGIHIINGDFNVPDISWETNTIFGSKQYQRRDSQTVLDIALDLGLEMVDFPTRQENTLDLILTSHPGFKLRFNPLPPLGLKSDHEIVLYDTCRMPICHEEGILGWSPEILCQLWRQVPRD